MWVVLGRERVGVLEHDVGPEVGVLAGVGVEAQLGVEEGVDGVVLDGEHLGGRPRVGVSPGHQHVAAALVLDNRAPMTQVSLGLEKNHALLNVTKGPNGRNHCKGHLSFVHGPLYMETSLESDT